MKLSLAIAALVAIASARSPVGSVKTWRQSPDLIKRHNSGLDTSQTTQSDKALSSTEASSPCKDIIFIFARGSTEPKPLGIIVGPGVCSALKSKFVGRVDCVGVSKKYTASMMDNGGKEFTTQVAIDDAISEFNDAFTKCPRSKIVFGGYSQGGAVMHGAVKRIPKDKYANMVAGVMFGDSMNLRDRGVIPGFPSDRILQVCHDGDGICAPTFGGITAAHLTYSGTDYSKAVNFMAQKINGFGGGSGGSGGVGKGTGGPKGRMMKR